MAQSLELLLIQFLMLDNDARRQAEDQIKCLLKKDPEVVQALIHHLRTAKTPNVLQLATVLLCKKITGHWAKLSSQLRQLVKQSLIESITLEQRADRVHKKTTENSLTETIGNAFRPHFSDLQSLLLKCLQDEISNRVRVAALKAVGSFIEFTRDEGEVVLSLVPELVNLFAQVAISPVETNEVNVHISRGFLHLISLYGHQMQRATFHLRMLMPSLQFLQRVDFPEKSNHTTA